MSLNQKPQSFHLGSLPAGGVALGLVVLAPHRRTRLASEQITGGQTIQYSVETL